MPLELEVVAEGEAVEEWKELVDRHHELGYRHPFGCFLRYWLRDRRGRKLGCLLFEAGTTRLPCRDAWDWLAGSGSGEASEGGGEQLLVPDFPLGSSSVSGLEGPVDGGSAAARGLEGAARPGAGTGGDLCGSGEVPGDLLPCGQLAVHWPDEGTQGECIGGRQDSEGRLPVSANERLEAGAADRLPSIRTPFPQAAGGGLGPGGYVCPALERHRPRRSWVSPSGMTGSGSGGDAC